MEVPSEFFPEIERLLAPVLKELSLFIRNNGFVAGPVIAIVFICSSALIYSDFGETYPLLKKTAGLVAIVMFGFGCLGIHDYFWPPAKTETTIGGNSLSTYHPVDLGNWKPVTPDLNKPFHFHTEPVETPPSAAPPDGPPAGQPDQRVDVPVYGQHPAGTENQPEPTPDSGSSQTAGPSGNDNGNDSGSVTPPADNSADYPGHVRIDQSGQ